MVKCVVAISGKRKSGKDYCTRLLKEELERKRVTVAVTGISISLKAEYARIHELDFNELLTDGLYKEKYRIEMIKWGEEARRRDSDVFCRAAMAHLPSADVVIVSDCRRQSDYSFFVQNYHSLTVRVETSEENRRERGYRFVGGVDDGESECGLDEYGRFDVILKNVTGDDLRPQIDKIVSIIAEKI